MSGPFSSEIERYDQIPRKPIPYTHTTSARHTTSEPDTTAQGYSKLKDAEETEISRKGTSIFHHWWFECLSCFFVLAALIAIISTLLPHDGKPTPQWPHQTSINTVVAVFVNILKFALILVIAEGLSCRKWAWFETPRSLHDLSKYDMASRGALGSVKLLYALRGRDWISCLGALLTIGALALDPFAQQLVQHFSCAIEDASMQATIPRTNMYFETGEHLFAGYSTVPAAVQASINLGLYFNGTEEVPFSCPTGTCHFAQQYHSMAYCYSCDDLTSRLTYNNSDMTNNWTLPSGLQLSSFLETPTYFVMSDSESGGVEMIFNGGGGFQTSGGPTPHECASSKNESFGCKGIGAASCSLFPCVRTYRATIENGNLTEQLISIWTQFGMNSFSSTYNAANVACMSAEDRQNVTDAGYIIEPGTEWLAYNTSIGAYGEGWSDGSLGFNDTAIQGRISEQCLYEISMITTNALEFWFSSFFNGKEIENSAEDWPTGPSVVDTFYESLLENVSLVTVDRMFGNIADSLTVHIRQSGDRGESVNASNPATGSVIRTDTCVRVHWGWLSYPIILALLTLVFFVSVIFGVKRRQDSGPGWKSSPLALVYHGLDKTILDRCEHERLDNIEVMVKAAEKLQVRLSRTENGWKFTT